jgi:DNA-nicking Smr family endonuclease
MQHIRPVAMPGVRRPEQRFGPIEPAGAQILQAGLEIGIGLALGRGCHGGLCRPASGLALHQTMAKDVDLFRAAMAGVKPLKRSRAPVIAEANAARPCVSQKGFTASLPGASAPVAAPAAAEQTFDRDVDRALSKGRRAPEAKLDLHGMTLIAAERAVANFIADSSAQNRRVVLIVTGKGLRLEGGRVFGGRIRAEFLGWLDRPENRARVTAVRAAHPRHGGSGAFYVLLRRRSSASSRSLRATPQR